MDYKRPSHISNKRGTEAQELILACYFVTQIANLPGIEKPLSMKCIALQAWQELLCATGSYNVT